MITKCSACGSTRLARGHVKVEGRRWPVSFYRPGGFLGLGRRTTGLRATACADCGGVQLVADDLHAIGELCDEERRGSLRLGH